MKFKYDVDLAREVQTKALSLARGGSYSSKDRRLYINYDTWEDYMTIFSVNTVLNEKTKQYECSDRTKVVFESKLGNITIFKEKDTEWITILRNQVIKKK